MSVDIYLRDTSVQVGAALWLYQPLSIAVNAAAAITDGLDQASGAASAAVAANASMADAADTASAGAAAALVANASLTDTSDTADASVSAVLSATAAIVDAADSHAVQAAAALQAALSATEAPDGFAALLAAMVTAAAALQHDADAFVASLMPPAPATALSPQHAAWLESLARVHGLVAPLQVSATARGDGTVTQTLAQAGALTTITTTARPDGAAGASALSAQQAGWLEALLRVQGLIDPLQVSATARGDGTLTQTITEAAGTVTLERTA